VVNVRDEQGQLLARGQTAYGADVIRRIQGRKTTEIALLLGAKDYDEVIHRDNLALLAEPGKI
jgi:glutamate 5-kinase